MKNSDKQNDSTDLAASRFEREFSAAGFLPLILSTESFPAKRNNQINYYKKLANQYFEKNSDKYFMSIALFEAHRNIKAASPNPCVGSVFVKDNRILSFGSTRAYGGFHAERFSAQNLSDEEIHGSTVYVTLEPCSHFGKQPPCSDFLIEKKVSKVVISSLDEDPLVSGEGIKKLEAAGISVVCGVLEKQSRLLLAPFFHNRKHNTIFYNGKWAQSLDGSLADDSGKSKWISSDISRRYTHWLRSMYDAILIGSSTAIADTPSLDIREIFSFKETNENQIRIVADPGNKLISHNDFENIFQKLKGKDERLVILISKNIELTKQAKENLSIAKGFTYACLDKENLVKDIDIFLNSEVLEKKFGKKIISCLVEGGPKLLTNFISQGKFSLLHTFIAPIFVGGKNNIIQHLGNFPRPIHDAEMFETLFYSQLGPDLLVQLKQASKP